VGWRLPGDLWYKDIFIGLIENMMRGEKINEVEAKRGRRSLKEADQGQDPGLGKEDVIDLDQETGEGKIIETGAGETETDLQEETEVLENIDQILHKGWNSKIKCEVCEKVFLSDDDWRSTPPNNTIMIRGLPLYVTEQHVRPIELRDFLFQLSMIRFKIIFCLMDWKPRISAWSGRKTQVK
jgi:hypothetical protein